MMKKLWLPALLTATVVMIGFSGCGLFPEEEVLAPPLMPPAVVSYTTTKVERSDIVDSVNASGVFISTNAYDLSFEKRAGYLAEIAVEPGDKVEKGQLLARLDTDQLEMEIKKQTLYVERARIAWDAAKKDSNATTASIRLAQIDYELQTLQLNQSKTELEKQCIYAPDDGVVAYISKAAAGEYIAARSTLLRIVDPTSLQVEATGDSVKDFQLGQEVTLTLDKKPYAGKIVMTAANAPYELIEKGKSFVRVEVTDPLPQEDLLGKNVNIELIRQKKEDVIVIPRNVVSMYSGDSYVLVLENGVKKERIIEPGIKTVTYMEVLSGLEEGEEIIIK